MQIPPLSNLFRRTAQRAGYFAIYINNKGVSFAQIKHAGNNRPRVMACTFHFAENVTPAALEKLRKNARISASQCITLLGPDEYQMLQVEAPNVPAEELKTAIRWRIKDSLNYSVDEAAVDVLKIPARNAGADHPQSVYAVAAHNDTVKKHLALFERAKIDLRVIDIPEMAQRNIAGLFEESGRGLALLSIDDSGGMLTITGGGELYLARRMEITAGQLQDANENLRQQYLERMELELQRSLDYAGRQFSHISIKRLLVSAPQQPGLVQLLAPGLDVPVEQLELAQVMDISAVPELADSAYVAQVFLALGAALRSEGHA